MQLSFDRTQNTSQTHNSHKTICSHIFSKRKVFSQPYLLSSIWAPVVSALPPLPCARWYIRWWLSALLRALPVMPFTDTNPLFRFIVLFVSEALKQELYVQTLLIEAGTQNGKTDCSECRELYRWLTNQLPRTQISYHGDISRGELDLASWDPALIRPPLLPSASIIKAIGWKMVAHARYHW